MLSINYKIRNAKMTNVLKKLHWCIKNFSPACAMMPCICFLLSAFCMCIVYVTTDTPILYGSGYRAT